MNRKSAIVGCIIGVLIGVTCVWATSDLSFQMQGNIYVSAGLNVELSGLTENNGVYTIDEIDLTKGRTSLGFKLKNTGNQDATISYTVTTPANLSIALEAYVTRDTGDDAFDGDSFTLPRGGYADMVILFRDLGLEAGSHNYEITLRANG